MSLAPMTPVEFARLALISAPVRERLEIYAATLIKWQKKINLVSAATLPDLWRRHMLDSAQLFPLLPKGVRVLADLGSGAGFPGLVLAILGVPEVHLIESDQRKAAFLREVARLTGTTVIIHAERIESLSPTFVPDVVTARALAPLDKLLELSTALFTNNPEFFFLKGKTLDDELTVAKKAWHMAVHVTKSRTDESGAIIHLREVRRD